MTGIRQGRAAKSAGLLLLILGAAFTATTHPSSDAHPPAVGLILFAACSVGAGALSAPALRDWLVWMGRFGAGLALAGLALASLLFPPRLLLLLLPAIALVGGATLLSARHERGALALATVVALLCAARLIDQVFSLTGRPFPATDALSLSVLLVVSLALYTSHAPAPTPQEGPPPDADGPPRLPAPPRKPGFLHRLVTVLSFAPLLLALDGIHKLRHELAKDPAAQEVAAGLMICALAGGYATVCAVRHGWGWRAAALRRPAHWEWLCLLALVGIAAPLR